MSKLQPQAGISLHHQISTLIKDAISTGRFRAGDQLPTEDELCRAHGVSRVTVRRAMESLQQQGLVERQRGRGTYVADSAAIASSPTPLQGFLDRLAVRRARSKPLVRSHGVVIAPPEVRLNLELDDEAEVLRVVRLRLIDGLPLMYSTAYLPLDIGRMPTRAQFARRSLTEVLQAMGQHYSRIEVVTRACLADSLLATELRVDVGSALVDVLRVGYNQAGRPIEHQSIQGPPDRYQTNMTVTG